MLSARAIGHFRWIFPSTATILRPILCTAIPNSNNVRFGSMKVKRIQKKKPLEKNRVKRLIKGTKLEPKKSPKRKSHHRNPDPNAYIDVADHEFNPWDITGRTTLKALASHGYANCIGTALYAYNSWLTTSSTTNP